MKRMALPLPVFDQRLSTSLGLLPARQAHFALACWLATSLAEMQVAALV